MFQLTINEKGGQTRQESFEKSEVTIGRVQGNDIILPKGNISKRHSRIVLKDGKFIIVDLKSTNGTYVNGKKITAPQVIKATDKVYIGDFTIQLSQTSDVSEDVGNQGRGSQEDAADLFSPGFDQEQPAAAVQGKSPGLIDDNFDQELGMSSDDALSRGSTQRPQPSSYPQIPDSKLPAPSAPVEAAAPLFDSASAGVDQGGFGRPEPKSSAYGHGLALSPSGSDANGVEKPVVAEAPAVQSPVIPVTTNPADIGSQNSSNGPLSAGSQLPVTPASAAPLAPVTPVQTPPPAQMSVVSATADAPVARGSTVPTSMETVDRDQLLKELHRLLLQSLSLQGRALSDIPALKQTAVELAAKHLEAYRSSFSSEESLMELAEQAARRALGVDLFVDLLEDDAVYEIVLTHDLKILVDRDGRLDATDRQLESESEAIDIIKAFAGLAGQDPEEIEPIVDVRLRNGARVIATLPPYAVRGPTLTIRKTTRDYFTLEKLCEYDTISVPIRMFLNAAVRYRTNMLLVVGPGVSATATLNALVSRISPEERVVAAERNIEMHLRSRPNAVAFDLNQGSIEGALQYAQTVQADRLVLGELQKDDAQTVVDALTDHTEGALVAISAVSIKAAFDKLVSWYGEDASEELKARVARAFPVVLQESRLRDNSRRITQISTISVEGGGTRTEDVFRFVPTGVDDAKVITGQFKPTGFIPSFIQEMLDSKEIDLDLAIFTSETFQEAE